MSQVEYRLCSVPILILVYLVAGLLLTGFRPSRRILWMVAVLGSAGFVVREVLIIRAKGEYDLTFDYRLYRTIGDMVLQGRDTYAPSEHLLQPNLWPPNAPPVWALFALPGPRPGYLIWLILNLALGVGLGILGRRALALPPGDKSGAS
jgi:hypothetical protein